MYVKQIADCQCMRCVLPVVFSTVQAECTRVCESARFIGACTPRHLHIQFSHSARVYSALRNALVHADCSVLYTLYSVQCAVQFIGQ